MSILTGNKDTDILVLMQLKDHELGPVCSANKYLNSICNDDKFWMNRIISNLERTCKEAKKSIPYFKENDCSGIGENMGVFKDYFGFSTYRELNSYLQKFTKGMQYSIYSFVMSSDYYDKTINKIYRIQKDLLPIYVDFEKLGYYVRREFVKDYYTTTPGRYVMLAALPNISGIKTIGYVKKNKPSPPDEELFKIDF